MHTIFGFITKKFIFISAPYDTRFNYFVGALSIGLILLQAFLPGITQKINDAFNKNVNHEILRGALPVFVAFPTLLVLYKIYTYFI
jgi:hypothetical protein